MLVSKIKNLKLQFNYTYALLGLLALVIIVLTILRGSMLWRIDIWLSMARQFPEYGLMVLAIMFCFISGNIDISFVALGNFCAILAILLIQALGLDGYTAAFAIIIISLALASVCGLVNGSLITRLRIPPILATLSMHMVYRGITVGITDGHSVSGIPIEFSQMIRQTSIFGLRAIPFLVFVLVVLFNVFVLKYTSFGKKVYMIGSNPKAAKFSAIKTEKVVTIVFIIAAIITTMGTLLMVAGMNSARADNGSAYLMRTILILVLAGVLPIGGIGKIVNVLIAIVTIQLISSGVNMFPQLNVYYRELISAIILLVVLMATSYLLGERKRTKTEHVRLDKRPRSILSKYI